MQMQCLKVAESLRLTSTEAFSSRLIHKSVIRGGSWTVCLTERGNHGSHGMSEKDFDARSTSKRSPNGPATPCPRNRIPSALISSIDGPFSTPVQLFPVGVHVGNGFAILSVTGGEVQRANPPAVLRRCGTYMKRKKERKK